jgi:hypothetical protein
MPFWRRAEPVHKTLGKALMNAQAGGYLAHPPDLAGNVTMGEVGLHGIPRPRRWDAVVTAEARLPGDTVHFVALPDGTLIVDEDVPDGALDPLAEAVEAELPRPYRAEATKRGAELWAVGASRIAVVRIPEEIDGDTIELAVRDGERTLAVDGLRAFGSVPSLEAVASGMAAYVIRAARIDDDLWEVTVVPL